MVLRMDLTFSPKINTSFYTPRKSLTSFCPKPFQPSPPKGVAHADLQRLKGLHQLHHQFIKQCFFSVINLTKGRFYDSKISRALICQRQCISHIYQSWQAPGTTACSMYNIATQHWMLKFPLTKFLKWPYGHFC